MPLVAYDIWSHLKMVIFFFFLCGKSKTHCTLSTHYHKTRKGQTLQNPVKVLFDERKRNWWWKKYMRARTKYCFHHLHKMSPLHMWTAFFFGAYLQTVNESRDWTLQLFTWTKLKQFRLENAVIYVIRALLYERIRSFIVSHRNFWFLKFKLRILTLMHFTQLLEWNLILYTFRNDFRFWNHDLAYIENPGSNHLNFRKTWLIC